MTASIAREPHGPASFVYRRDSIGYATLRRTVDVVASLLVLIATMPVHLAAIVAIKLEDGGPAFFMQRRVGRFGKLFTIYKLRTMRVDACGDGLSPAGSSDARVTKVGVVLRRTSIDELPQLINVLRSDMSLVGPRPEQPFLASNYKSPWQRLRQFAKPGITCFWQIRCRSTVPLHEPSATAHDLEYIESASPVTDVAILLGTVGAVLKLKGAY